MYKLETHYLDVGQGDCSLIVVRQEETDQIVRVVVYDCGSDSGEFAATKLLEKCRTLGIEAIHVAVISHFDEDHFNGFTHLFKMGKAKGDNNYARQLFENTKVYSQGCIFQQFAAAKILNIKNKVGGFLSAYYFQTDTIKEGTSILLEYTNVLDAMYNFRNSFKDSEGDPMDVGFEHVSERYLAGYPTAGWSPKSYRPGTYRVYAWKPTRRVATEKYTHPFKLVTFGAANSLLGVDLLNNGFDDDVHNSITLTCIAVNKEVYNPGNIFSDTKKPKKSPNVANNMSLSCLLKYRNYSAFFGGDLETPIEDQLIPVIKHLTDNQGLTVLKAGHHGSDESTSTEFLEKMTPKTVVITCGEENPHGHPHIGLIERLHNSEVDQVIIAGFALLDESELEANKKFGVPLGTYDIYNPNSKFALAGTFSIHEDGSIKIHCAQVQDGDEVEPIISFTHTFTEFSLVDRRNERLAFSKDRGVELLTKETTDRKRKWSVGALTDEEGVEVPMLMMEHNGVKITTFTVEPTSGRVIVKKQRTE